MNGDLYENKAPILRKFVIKILSQIAICLACERNWSTFALIPPKEWNHLTYPRLQHLVFILFYYNKQPKLQDMKSTNEKVTKTIYIYIIFCKRVISLSRDICEKYGSICICMYSCHLFICSWMVVHVWEQSSYIEEVDNQDFVTNFIVFNLWEKLTKHIHFDLNERIIVTPTPSFNM